MPEVPTPKDDGLYIQTVGEQQNAKTPAPGRIGRNGIN